MRKFLIPFLKKLLKLAEGPQTMALEVDSQEVKRELEPKENNLKKRKKGKLNSLKLLLIKKIQPETL